jgi:hypothetical protein
MAESLFVHMLVIQTNVVIHSRPQAAQAQCRQFLDARFNVHSACGSHVVLGYISDLSSAPKSPCVIPVLLSRLAGLSGACGLMLKLKIGKFVEESGAEALPPSYTIVKS